MDCELLKSVEFTLAEKALRTGLNLQSDFPHSQARNWEREIENCFTHRGKQQLPTVWWLQSKANRSSLWIVAALRAGLLSFGKRGAILGLSWALPTANLIHQLPAAAAARGMLQWSHIPP